MGFFLIKIVYFLMCLWIFYLKVFYDANDKKAKKENGGVKNN